MGWVGGQDFDLGAPFWEAHGSPFIPTNPSTHALGSGRRRPAPPYANPRYANLPPSAGGLPLSRSTIMQMREDPGRERGWRRPFPSPTQRIFFFFFFFNKITHAQSLWRTVPSRPYRRGVKPRPPSAGFDMSSPPRAPLPKGPQERSIRPRKRLWVARHLPSRARAAQAQWCPGVQPPPLR